MIDTSRSNFYILGSTSYQTAGNIRSSSLQGYCSTLLSPTATSGENTAATTPAALQLYPVTIISLACSMVVTPTPSSG